MNVMGPNNAQWEKNIPIPKSMNLVSLRAERSIIFPPRSLLGLIRGRISKFPRKREKRKMKPTIRIVHGNPI
jgi:hypothetical protein